MDKTKIEEIIKGFALCLFLLSLIANPLTLEQVLSPDKKFDYMGTYFIIFGFDFALLLLSIFMWLRAAWIVRHPRELLLLCVSVPVCVLILEVGLGVYYVATLQDTIEEAYKIVELPEERTNPSFGAMIRASQHRNIIYEFKPGLNVYFSGVRVRTNSSGWRDSEFTKQKVERTIRIAGIGDSVMFGWGVSENDRYMDVLERLLKKSFPDYRWETMVFAVPGYNAKIELEVLKRYVSDYNPDIVIIGFVDNDLCLPNFLMPGKFFSSESFIVHYLYPYKFKVKEYFLLTSISKDEVPFYTMCDRGRVPWNYRDFVGEKMFRSVIEEYGRFSRLKDIPVVMFAMGDLTKYTRDILKNDIYLINVTPEYSKNYHSERKLDFVISEEDGHPSALAHELIAAGIYRDLVGRNIVQKIIGKIQN